MNKKGLLSFDLEEFDLPEQYSQILDEKTKLTISLGGLNKLLALLDSLNARATFFTTSFFASKNKLLVNQISKKHEIACHGEFHSDSYLHEKDFLKIARAKKQIEAIIGKKIMGFRAPRLEIKNISKLADLGFKYDSSLHPTWAPGKYFNIFKKRKIHKIGKVIEVPLSTLPVVRAPINWFIFRNFPRWYRHLFAKLNPLCSDYLMLLFHPWEFADLSEFSLPKSLTKNTGDSLVTLLKDYLVKCRKNKFTFETFSTFLLKAGYS